LPLRFSQIEFQRVDLLIFWLQSNFIFIYFCVKSLYYLSFTAQLMFFWAELSTAISADYEIDFFL